MKIKCYSVRLESLYSISDKAYKAKAYDGSEAIIPKSQVFGEDFSVSKSDAYWISAWILSQKEIQYSIKKAAIYDTMKHSFESTIIERYTPIPIDPKENTIEELKK